MTNPPSDPGDTPADTAGLRLGFVRGVTLTKWRRIWDERFRIPLEVVELAQADQRRALMWGDVDMAFVRLPIDRDGLHLIPLYDEDPVVWMSADHVLAELDELTTDDLADERVIDDAEPESVELATYSAAVLRVPLSVARTGSRKDLVHRRLVDAEPTSIGLAWLADADNPLIEEFIGVVRGRKPESSRTRNERSQRRADGADPQKVGPQKSAPQKSAPQKAGPQKSGSRKPAPKGASASRRAPRGRR